MDVTTAEAASSQAPPRPGERRGALAQMLRPTSSWARFYPVLLGLLAAFLAFERLTKKTRLTIWAEDGAMFLTDAMQGQYDLLAPYAGYLHAVPRAAAIAVVHTVAVHHYPLGVNIGACLVAGLISAVVYVCAEELVPNALPRTWLALLTVLLPLVGVEVLTNLANVHSLLLWGTFWALLRLPRSRAGAVGLALFTLLSALSEIQIAVLLPVGLLSLWKKRSLRQALVLSGCMLGVAGQVWTTLNHPRVNTPHWLDFSIMSRLMGLQIAMPLWVLKGSRIQALLEHHGWWLAVAAALPLFIGLTLSLRSNNLWQQLIAIAAVAIGIIVFSASQMLNSVVMGGPDYSVLKEAYPIFRYGVVPSLFFAATLAIGTSAALHMRQKTMSWLGIAAMAALSLSSVRHFRTRHGVRAPRTAWPAQIPKARASCEERGPSGEYTFDISPPGWTMSVSCSRVLADSP